MKYKKKPIIIDAFQPIKIVRENPPKWFTNAISCSIIHVENNTLHIRTLEGTMTANMEDYVIRGIHGELYSCKPDIFFETYERV